MSSLSPGVDDCQPEVHQCSQEQIESYLSGELDSCAEQTLVTHLDTCEQCCIELEVLAATEKVWREASTFLQQNIVNESCSASKRRALPMQVQGLLDSLAPTDDPEMLGRLGSYEVSGVIGVGGMGVVMKAYDRSLDRTVAVKVLAPHLASSGAARNRFSREAKAAAAVLHPNVIAIHGVSTDDHLPWLVMPYVSGQSLQKRIDKQGQLNVDEILRISSQIASGLAAAHAQGLVHRDIKPANVLLEEGVERVTLTDFGLARAVDDATMTRSGVVAGTPQYMSPEQARGELVDGRSDLFSLGSLLYAMCTGHAPFRSETTFGVMRRIADEQARPIQEINADIPVWLSSIIERLMAKDPQYRFQTSEEVATILAECLAHTQQPLENPLPKTLVKPYRNGPPGKGFNRTLVAVWVVALLGLAGIIGWLNSDAPDISGVWNSEEWGTVTLVETEAGEYRGTWHGSNGLGTLDLTWSALQHRFNGKWRNQKEQFGKLSIRKRGENIHGARTLNEKSNSTNSQGRLTDFVWQPEHSRTPHKPNDVQTDTTANETANDRPSAFESSIVTIHKDEFAFKADPGIHLRPGQLMQLLDGKTPVAFAIVLKEEDGIVLAKTESPNVVIDPKCKVFGPVVRKSLQPFQQRIELMTNMVGRLRDDRINVVQALLNEARIDTEKFRRDDSLKYLTVDILPVEHGRKPASGDLVRIYGVHWGHRESREVIHGNELVGNARIVAYKEVSKDVAIVTFASSDSSLMKLTGIQEQLDAIQVELISEKMQPRDADIAAVNGQSQADIQSKAIRRLKRLRLLKELTPFRQLLDWSNGKNKYWRCLNGLSDAEKITHLEELLNYIYDETSLLKANLDTPPSKWPKQSSLFGQEIRQLTDPLSKERSIQRWNERQP